MRTSSASRRVYQDLAQAPDLTVAENMFLGREPLQAGIGRFLGTLARRQMYRETEAALERLGISLPSVHVAIRQLSGGQRQAVAVARAAMWASRAILMDEPTAALGTKQTRIVYRTMRAAAERGLAVVVISHDIPRMLKLAQRLAIMRHGVVIATLTASDTDLTEVISLMLGTQANALGEGMAMMTNRQALAVVSKDPSDDPRNRQRTPGLMHHMLGLTSFWMGLVILGLIALFSIVTPDHDFFQLSNFQDMAIDVTETMVLALGMTFILGAGELDLSIGANLLLSSVLAGQTIVNLAGNSTQVASGIYPHEAMALVVGTGVAIVSGIVFGAVNGLLVTTLRISSFIVTLGTMGVGLGIGYVVSNGVNVPYIPRDLQLDFGVNRLWNLIPLPTIVVLVLAMVLWYLLFATRFGMHTLAIGSSREAAIRAGIPARAHVFRLFVLMGALAGVNGMLDLARFGTTNVGGHQTDALGAIAATVIGGTSLFGGVASIGGAMIGSMLPTILGTGLVILGVATFYQLIVVGIILIIAVSIDQHRRNMLN